MGFGKKKTDKKTEETAAVAKDVKKETPEPQEDSTDYQEWQVSSQQYRDYVLATLLAEIRDEIKATNALLEEIKSAA